MKRASGRVVVCDDCGSPLYVIPAGILGGGDGSGEWFMLKDRVWSASQSMGDARFLCVGCIERRIGRRLSSTDFRRSAKVNFAGTKTPKLRQRMRGLEPARRLIHTTFRV
jgi:hypothetical protein